MNTFNDDPNFSIVVPGGCNADCHFCFGKHKKQSVAPVREYISSLHDTLTKLPEQFYQISITGGEPLISPFIDNILISLFPHKEKYHNILLTTNGTNLLEKIDLISMSVDHINISRHHYDKDENRKIFSGSYSITDEYLAKAIDEYSVFGIDISANCVINDTTNIDFIRKYIEWARKIGFRAVRFRKENGDLAPTTVEDLFNSHKVLWTGKCPVCRTKKQMIHGLDVFWKSSTLEPSETITDNIFEVVFAPDAKIYEDWEYEKPIALTKKSVNPLATLYRSYANSLNGGLHKEMKSVGYLGSSCGGGVSQSSCGGGYSSGRC